MDKELYDEILADISIQFGAGDTVEPEDREFCAKQIVDHLQQLGYRKADEVRKETAIEIYNSLIDETVWETDTIIISVDWLKDKIKNYGIEVDE